MMKYALILFLLCSSLFAYPTCSRDLESAVQMIYHFPEGKKLIEEVEAKGALRIYRAPFNSHSCALWSGDDRSIVINSNQSRTFGEIVRSIFFELHNAKADGQFLQLDRMASSGQINKAQYIESIERLEHQNAYQTSHSIQQAIRGGYFPQDAAWPIYADFQAHYRIQKQTGHSADIASVYDSICRIR